MNLIKYQQPNNEKKIYTSKSHSNQSINSLINKRKKVGVENLKNSKAFIDCSQIIDVVYGNLGDYIPTKIWRILIVIDKMIVHMESNKKLSPIVTELFLRGRKRNI